MNLEQIFHSIFAFIRHFFDFFLHKLINIYVIRQSLTEVIRAYKYKLKPTNDQKQLLEQYFGSARFVWNKMLEANITEYEKSKKFIWSKTFQKEVTQLKSNHDWLKAIPSQSLQQRCDDLEQSLRRCSRKNKKQPGFPKFQSKHKPIQSFRIPQQNRQILPFKAHIKLPKIGNIKWNRHRAPVGQIKFVTIKREYDDYFAVLCCEVPDKEVLPYTKDSSVGIDLGLTTFAVLSDGTEYHSPKSYKKSEDKLKKLQKSLSKKKKGSSNRNKARKKVNKLHKKIRNQRHDFLHKTSNEIANRYEAVFVEDLNIEAIKKRFGKQVSDVSWYSFINYLTYKVNFLGKIDRYAPSSKFCSICEIKHDTLKLSDRKLPCCGIDRDKNASINIRNWGFEKYTDGTSGSACGDESLLTIARDVVNISSVKQEKFFE